MSNLKLRGFVEPFNVDDHDNIKDYYTTAFPTDELGLELNERATFMEMKSILINQKDFYEYVGVYDSLIRERLFERLAELIGATYNDVYGTWLILAD
jgi:hypothetical protein